MVHQKVKTETMTLPSIELILDNVGHTRSQKLIPQRVKNETTTLPGIKYLPDNPQILCRLPPITTRPSLGGEPHRTYIGTIAEQLPPSPALSAATDWTSTIPDRSFPIISRLQSPSESSFYSGISSPAASPTHPTSSSLSTLRSMKIQRKSSRNRRSTGIPSSPIMRQKRGRGRMEGSKKNDNEFKRRTLHTRHIAMMEEALSSYGVPVDAPQLSRPNRDESGLIYSKSATTATYLVLGDRSLASHASNNEKVERLKTLMHRKASGPTTIEENDMDLILTIFASMTFDFRDNDFTKIGKLQDLNT